VIRTRAEVRESGQHFRAVLAIQPRSAPARFGLSRVYAALDRPDLALQQLLIADELDPANVEYEFHQARVLGDLGRKAEQRAILERLALTEDHEWVSGWSTCILACGAVGDGRYAEGRELAEAAWDSDVSANSYIRTLLVYPFAMLTAATGDESHSLEARRRFDLEFTGLPEAYRRYSGSLLMIARPIGDPWFEFTASEAGRALILAQAVEVAQQGLRYDPEYAGLLWNLGLANYWRGDFDAALTAWAEHREVGADDDPRNWLATALACHAKGDINAAREWYARAIEWMAIHPTEDLEHIDWYRSQVAGALGR
jgi:tetratricopeptide (TPR) repeat protein